MKTVHLAALLASFLSIGVHAASCGDPADTFEKYNERVPDKSRNDIGSEYYVMSYSWAPAHCKSVDRRSREPGGRDYLQCGSGRNFGYVLHGLWPQGSKARPGDYPRACEGDQKRIDRKLLEKYLCMSPSVWLLQHEYEYHGTCMHDEALEEPEVYFDTALRLHSQLKLPDRELPDTPESRRWLLANNPHLKAEAIQYYAKGREWQFCYDTRFSPTSCPAAGKSASRASPEADPSCRIKGNISRGQGGRLYFTPDHPNYAAVKISPDAGERCFGSEQEAIGAGWRKAP
jgi:ribonuclease T2